MDGHGSGRARSSGRLAAGIRARRKPHSERAGPTTTLRLTTCENSAASGFAHRSRKAAALQRARVSRAMTAGGGKPPLQGAPHPAAIFGASFDAIRFGVLLLRNASKRLQLFHDKK